MSSTTREINLFCRNGYFLQINGKGEMSGTHAKESKFAVIKVSTVDHGVVTLQAVVSGLYVAVDSAGKVHTKKLFTEECLFYEECTPAHGYISYRSFRYGKRKYYLGISRRGKVRPASKILADQNCAKFLHLNARETDGQTKTNEQTIEEEQIKKALAAQVQMQQVSRKVGLTKSQKQEARKEALMQQKLEQPEVTETTIPSEKKRKKKKKKPAEEDAVDEKDQDTSFKLEGKQKQEDVNQAKKKVNQTAGNDKPDKTNSNDQTAKKQKLSQTKEQAGKNQKQAENKDKPVKMQKQTGDKDQTKKKEKQTDSKGSNVTQSEDRGKDQKTTTESQKGESYKKKETPSGNNTVKGPKQESDKVIQEVVDPSSGENGDKGQAAKKSKDKTAKQQEQKESSADKTPKQPTKTTAADDQLKMASTEGKEDQQSVKQEDTKDSLEKKEERAEDRKDEKKEDKKRAKKEDKKKDKKGDKKDMKEEKKEKNGQTVQTVVKPLEVTDQSKKNESHGAEQKKSTEAVGTTPKQETAVLVEDQQSTKTPDKDQKQPAEGQTDVKKKTAKKRSNDDQQEMQGKLDTEMKNQGERKDGKKDKQAKKSTKSGDDGQTGKKQKKTQAKTDEEGAKKPKQETSAKKPEKVDSKDQGTKNNEDTGTGDVAAKPPKEEESYQPESKLTAAESSDKGKAATTDQETKKNKKKKKQKTNNADAKTDQKSEQLQQQNNEATGASKPEQTVDITTTVVQEQIPVEDSQLIPQNGIVAQTSMVDSEPKPEANEVGFVKQDAVAEQSQPQQAQELNNNQEDNQPDSNNAIGFENQLPSEVSYTATGDAEEIQPLLCDSVEFEESSLPPSFGTSLGSQEHISSQLQVESSGKNIPTSTPTWSDIVQQQPPQIDHQQVGSSKTVQQMELAEQAVSQVDAPNTAQDIPGQISIDRGQMKRESASSPSWSDIVQQSPQAVNDGAVPGAEQQAGSEQGIYSCQDIMTHSNVPEEHPAQVDLSLPTVQQELPHVDKDEVPFDGFTQQSQKADSLDPNQSTAAKNDSLSDEQTSAQTNAEQVITDKSPTWSDIVQQSPQQTIETDTRTSVNQTNQASMENQIGSPENSRPTNQDQVSQPTVLSAGNVPSDSIMSQTPTWSDIVQSSPQQIVQGETEVNTSQDKSSLPKELPTGQVTGADAQVPLSTSPEEPGGKKDSSSTDIAKQDTEAGQEQAVTRNKTVDEAVSSEQPTFEASGVRIDNNLSITGDTPTFSDIIQQQSLHPLQSLPPSVPEPKSEVSEDIMRDPAGNRETVLAAPIQSEPDVWEQYLGGHEDRQDLAPVVSGPTEPDVWEQYMESPEGKQEVSAAPVQSKGHMGIADPVVSAGMEPDVEQYMESPKDKEDADHVVPASMEPDVWEQYMESPEDKKGQVPAFPASTGPDVWEQYIGSPEDTKDKAPTIPHSMEPDVWEQYMESPEDKKEKVSVVSAPTEPDVSGQNTGGQENKKEQAPEPDVSEECKERPEDKQGKAPAFPHQTTPDIWEDFLSDPEDTQIDTSMVSTQMQDTQDPETSENKDTEVDVQFSKLDKGQEKQSAPISGDELYHEQQRSENRSAEVNRENEFHPPQNNTTVPDTMVGQPSCQESEAMKEPILQMQQQDETHAAPVLLPFEQPPPGLPPLQQQPPELATTDPYAQELAHQNPSATAAATPTSIQAPTPTDNSAVPYDHPWTANFNQQQSVNIPMEPEPNIWQQYMGSGGVATGVEQKQPANVWDQYMTPMGFMEGQEASASTMQFAHAFFEDDINDEQQQYDSTGQQPSQQNTDAVTGQQINAGQQAPENVDFGTSVDGPQSQVQPPVDQNFSSQQQIPQAASQSQIMQEPHLDHAGFSDNSFGQSVPSPQQQIIAQNTESQSGNRQTAPMGSTPTDMATDGNVQLPEQSQVVQQVAVESPATNTNSQEFAEGAQVEEALEASMLDDLHID